MQPSDLRALIHSTLTPLGLYSKNAEELLVATCCQESLMGKFRTQAPHGPARGIFQCEGATFQDLFLNFLDGRSALYTQVASLFNEQPPSVDELVTNDPAAIAICRLQYYRFPEPLPDAGDLEGIWLLYKKRYNGPGAATQEEFMQHYNELVK